MLNFVSFNFFSRVFAYASLFATGAIVLVIEIAGTRVLSPFFGATVYTWTSLIIVTLGSLALGYFLGGLAADKFPERKWFYVLIFSGAAVSLALIKINQYILVFGDFFGFKFGPLVSAAFLFFAPLFLFGCVGPFLVKLETLSIEKIGFGAGVVFGVSTLGSLFGAVLAGFFLIPVFSLKIILTVAAIIMMIFAIIGLILEKISWKLLIIFLFVFLAILFMPFFEVKDSGKAVVIHEEPSFYADLKVVELPFVKTLLMDGAPQSVFSKDNGTVFAEEPDQLKRVLAAGWPADAEVLVLGFGVGSVAQLLPKELKVDYVEIDEKMIKMAEKYFNFKIDKNDHVFFADARSFLRKSDKKYDVIFVDLYNGSFIPIHTHTKEALESMAGHLKPNGLLMSNIVGAAEDTLTRSLFKTLASVFSNVEASAKTQAGMTNILAYSSMSENLNLYMSYKHKKVSIDLEGGELITDNMNPIEKFSSRRGENFIKGMKEIFGRKVLFAI